MAGSGYRTGVEFEKMNSYKFHTPNEVNPKVQTKLNINLQGHEFGIVQDSCLLI